MLNWRVLVSVAERLFPSEVACVEGEKYPPVTVREPDAVEVAGKLSGAAAMAAGRTGITFKGKG
jgi:hypothetical protein